MSKQAWQAHMKEAGFESTSAAVLGPERTKQAREHVAACVVCKARSKTRKANARRSERDQVMRDCGLVKVIGDVSGRTYWE